MRLPSACVQFGTAGIVFRFSGTKLAWLEVPVALGGSLLIAAFTVRVVMFRQAMMRYYAKIGVRV